ncbi:heparinase II/III domain-containing protein [Butyrivibrio proteoclasticus]|uniref:heparinase II/III domain-containing protein n=1 Tax=Butyrivibrio proteoclasticus TaxID=43305 RepID=UPI0006879560|nr:heparinase II/III family protein [Butyrivibrio proteoclasticus]
MNKSADIVKRYVQTASGSGLYTRIPDISDRKAWEAIPDDYKKLLIEQGERAKEEPWTALLISDFREFKKNGNRVKFEDKYFPRRRKLGKLVMAECVENKGRFVEDILDGLYLILEETTWCLPPHTSYERDKEQEPMPDVTRPIIDLFDAESGAFVAFVEYLLRPVFSEISPYISGYVNDRLRERIFTPYETQHFWWMGNGDEPMCNWTVWCVQNVLLCAFTREKSYFSEEKRLEYLQKAAASCDYFLKDYGDDGACSEGAQYYSHAGLCLFGCLEVMSGAIEDGVVNDLSELSDARNESDSANCLDSRIDLASSLGFDKIYSEQLIKNIATYISKVHACGDYYINFADCSALPGRRTAREFLFGKYVGDSALMSLAAKDVMADLSEGRAIDDEINLFYRALQAFAMKEIEEYKPVSAGAEDVFLDSIGLMVARDSRFVLATKAGNNGDSHNHNDVGSFTIYKDGKPFIIDLGVGTYTAKTFSDRRYDIWTMQSQFHNLPTFIDRGQNAALIMEKDGAQYGAKDVTCILCRNGVKQSTEGTGTGVESAGGSDSLDGSTNDGKEISSLKMDIAGAYDDFRILSYIREVSLIKGQGVVVRDHYDGDADAFLSLMTYEKPEIVSDNSANLVNESAVSSNESAEVVVNVGTLGTITVTGVTKAQIQEYPIEDERLAIAWKHPVYRILLTLNKSDDIRLDIK